jgi:short-chain Z-isoprenyl diphosphate synthase
MLDGNRRWAKTRGTQNPKAGHEAGALKIFEFLTWCDEIGIPMVTLYLLSTDNLKNRKPDELQDLLGIITDVADEMAYQQNWRLHVMGDRDLLPANIAEKLDAAVAKTANLDKPHVNLAVGYGGRKEIADAMRSILKDHAKQGTTIEELAELLDPELISEHLYTSGQPDPDLIIRTSGEQRMSGFLLWQSASSELYFEEALWPDFRKVDFLRALRAFEKRHRRYGA